MSGPVLVTGGTGTLGRLVVARLHDAGRDVRVLSRGRRAAPPATSGAGAAAVETVTADLDRGTGVEAAIDGVDIVVHCAGGPRGDGDKAATLVRAATRAGAPHVVLISVVGSDRIPLRAAADRAMFGYYGSKVAAEQVVAGSGLPFTTLRATQFHDLVLTVAQQLTRLPVVPVPAGFRFQPVDAGEVATRLTQLALGEPAGLVPDMGGPRAYPLAELVRSYLRAVHRRRTLVPLPVLGGAAAAFRAGANLAPEHAVGRRTWEDFLAERVR